MNKLKAIRIAICWFIVFGLMSLLLVPFSAFATDGKLVIESVHSPALEGNLLGDSPDRSVIIYLPPGYEDNPDKRYPVFYLLHGWSDDPFIWTKTRNISNICNTLIEQGAIQHMIIVMPNAKNRYLGSWYTNSSVAGNWEDFITKELVAYVDSTYRTIPQSASRGITGHSMGGYGAMKLAMKHPDIYGAVYAMSGVIVFDNYYLDIIRNCILSTVKAESSLEDWQTMIVISSAVVFAPNQDTQPFQCDFPLDEKGQLVESVWQRWLQHDPLTMIASYKENLLQLKGLCFDCGTSDDLCIIGNRIFSQALTDANIPHVFEEYDGDHISDVRDRMEKHVLPFFSETLVF